MATGDFGLRPVKKIGGARWTGGRNAYLVSNGYASDLFMGDPVKLSAGNVVLAVNGDKVLGVFLGASYVDSNGTQQLSERFISGSSVSAGGLPIDNIAGIAQPIAYVADDPGLVMVIRADNSVSVGHFGKNFQVSVGTGNTATKRSGANLKVGSATASGVDAASSDARTMVRLMGIYNTPGNSIGATNPLCEVIWIAHANNFTNS